MSKHILKENYERFFEKREFGDPLPTFEDVMKRHQINKLEEDWWDDMDASAQAQYIKAHPGSKQAQKPIQVQNKHNKLMMMMVVKNRVVKDQVVKKN